MARRVAWSMFTRSIVSASTKPTPMATARERMTTYSDSRSSGVNRFESSTPAIRVPGPSTTAAATTGPASGPRPASSSPATDTSPCRQAAFSKRYAAGAVAPGSCLLALARGGDHGNALFFQARRLARQIPQVVQLRAPHRGPLHHLDLVDPRSEEHTSELQSHVNLVC